MFSKPVWKAYIYSYGFCDMSKVLNTRKHYKRKLHNNKQIQPYFIDVKNQTF